MACAGTANPHAHDLFVSGARLAWHTDEPSVDGVPALFEQTIRIDPDYAVT
ncbi:MAG TPA: hypothetical protein VF292_06475 [Rhodanobacteraceae bacterium]